MHSRPATIRTGSGDSIASHGDDGAQNGSPQHRFARELFSPLPGHYDLLAELLSFGQNRRWRREMLRHVTLLPGGLALDVATGTAAVAMELAERSGARIVGADVTHAMVREGALRVRRRGLAHCVQLIVGPAEALPFADGTFDTLTFTYLLRYVDAPAATM